MGKQTKGWTPPEDDVIVEAPKAPAKKQPGFKARVFG